MEKIKKCKEEQRNCINGEPVCCICGRYGEYICAITDQDICSTECKNRNLALKNYEIPPKSAETFEEFLLPRVLSNVGRKGTKAELDVLPAILYQRDVLIVAPKGIDRISCLAIPLVQRISVTGSVTF